MVEDIAAHGVGRPPDRPAGTTPDDDLVERLHHRYTTRTVNDVQTVGVPEMRRARPRPRSGSSPAASISTAPRRSNASRATRAEVAAALDASAAIPVRVVVKPVLTDAEDIRRVCQEAERRPGLRRADHLDAHVLAGQDVDRRPECAPEARCSTCTRSTTARFPGPTIDMDFMNLNQAAHGDREFGFMAARMRLERKVVVGHWKDPEVQATGSGAWARAACAWRDWAGRPDRPLRRQHARRRRHRRRQGGGAASGWGSASTATGSATWSALVEAGHRCRGRRAGRACTWMSTTSRPSCARGGERADVAARRRADRAWPAALPRGGPLQGLHHHLRGPARPDASCPAWRSSG